MLNDNGIQYVVDNFLLRGRAGAAPSERRRNTDLRYTKDQKFFG